jgi:hypothetical protein
MLRTARVATGQHHEANTEECFGVPAAPVGAADGCSTCEGPCSKQRTCTGQLSSKYRYAV